MGISDCCIALIAVVAVVCVPCAMRADDAAPRGAVSFSDGMRIEGKVLTKPDTKLSIDAGGVKEFRLSEVVEIANTPAKEEMERAWRFKEAGKTEKEFFGEPYPLRYLTAEVSLTDGRKLKGSLKAVPIDLLDDAGKKRKVILLSKQRGEAGTSFEALVYPRTVTFTWAVSSGGKTLTVQISQKYRSAKTELSTLGKPGLLNLTVKATGEGNYVIEGDVKDGIFAAVKTADAIVAAWPSSSVDGETTRKVAAALADLRDFFDQKTILGVAKGAGRGELYTLLLLAREGKTTLDASDNSPWRLEVWRWKGGSDEDDKLAVVGRGCLFRGIGPADVKPPPVTLDSEAVTICKDADTQ